ncbi:YcaO-like family protein [Kitasatospora cineracea]|uniref:Ribosomal protein S12 methylthiotransferase accessory factor n=1 Tax=Kitasatospora cineracea TaxID=88074 RepID=A0A8G1UCK6_9ACTN|nr:YcaO-like family protein [Kitasatospora cineracea]ROR37436.1 ribosomal protein S12 methylthiotransferase accessory factor [Kitasatospora cineracea]
MAELLLPGTRRAVAPETTWARIAPLLPGFGITRVADVTRLDVIGIPVVLAARPDSETLAVSQGKGATELLARLSAVMESIELRHAERPELPRERAVAADLALPYRLDELPLAAGGLPVPDVEQLRLEWVAAYRPADGSSVMVPFDVVRLSFAGGHFWRPRIFRSGSTGLASGNTWTEAALHGLYEAVERDVLAGLGGPRAGGVPVDPASVPDGHLRALLARLDAAAVSYELAFLPNRYQVPTFAARVWSPLFPIVCAGSGSHADPSVALSRAVTEAVQSRLTEITATRDDIPSGQQMVRDAVADPGFRGRGAGVSWDRLSAGHRREDVDMERELASLVARVEAVTARPVLTVDLSSRPELFSVVRVVCPGLAWSEGRTLGH